MKHQSKFLMCGCCGVGFRTWDGYQDQDQDKGYGICKPCQADEQERNRAEMDKSIKLISDALNKENKAKFDAMTREEKEWVVDCAFRDGILEWKIQAYK